MLAAGSGDVVEVVVSADAVEGQLGGGVQQRVADCDVDRVGSCVESDVAAGAQGDHQQPEPGDGDGEGGDVHAGDRGERTGGQLLSGGPRVDVGPGGEQAMEGAEEEVATAARRVDQVGV